MTYAVIMAGGIGSRFWPRSRRKTPKQFISVFEEATLIQNTVARLQGVVPAERCLVVTHERYVEQTHQQLPAVPRENILAEPISRNTAPCIAYAATVLAERDPDATMIVLPADHVIRNVARFHETLKVAIDKAATPGALVTIGITPTHPATGYGYIQFDAPATGDPDLAAYPVLTFAEKPDLATAERFVDAGDFLWNSGMFIWRADSVLGAVQEHLPDTYEAFGDLRACVGTPDETDAVMSAFQKSQGISIDYGVMERSDQVFVVPGDFEWSDVGDWRAVYDLSEKDEHGNAVSGKALLHNSSRCLVESSDRLVALVGMHDTMVIETPDALLVCHRENAQQVKSVVDYLYAHQMNDLV